MARSTLFEPGEQLAVVFESVLEREQRVPHPPAAPFHVARVRRPPRTTGAVRAARVASLSPSEDVPDLC